MPNTGQEDLQRSARSLLDRFMLEADKVSDDAANPRVKIDEVPPSPGDVPTTAAGEEMINVAA
jgi:hypothetical protein